jgi:hypothetical protein
MSPMSFESAYNEASKLFGNFIKINTNNWCAIQLENNKFMIRTLTVTS